MRVGHFSAANVFVVLNQILMVKLLVTSLIILALLEVEWVIFEGLILTFRQIRHGDGGSSQWPLSFLGDWDGCREGVELAGSVWKIERAGGRAVSLSSRRPAVESPFARPIRIASRRALFSERV